MHSYSRIAKPSYQRRQAKRRQEVPQLTVPEYPECLKQYSVVCPQCASCQTGRGACSEVQSHYQQVSWAPLERCKHKYCSEMKTPDLLELHQRFCTYRKTVCPLKWTTSCKWSGYRAHLRHHCRQEHSITNVDQAITYINFAHQCHTSNEISFATVYLHGEVFRLAMLYSQPRDQIKWNCTYLGTGDPEEKVSEVAEGYVYQIKFDGLQETLSGTCVPYSEDFSSFECKFCIIVSRNTLLKYCNQYGDLIIKLRVFDRYGQLSEGLLSF